MIPKKTIVDELIESEKKYYNSPLMISFGKMDSNNNVNVERTSCVFHPRHMHDCIEIVYVVKGNIQLWQSYKTRILKAGDFVFINHFDLHHYESLDGAATIISIHISPELYPSEEGMLFTDPIGMKEESELHKRSVAAIMALEEAYKIEKRETSIKKAVNHLLTIIRNELKLAAFDNEGGKICFSSQGNYNLIRKNDIYMYLYARYSKKINLEDLSKEVGLSRYHLSRYIRKYFGYTYNDLLKYIRCDRAEIPLLEGEKTLTEIAEECGFSSERMFKLYFCEVFHATPREYREFFRNKTLISRDFENIELDEYENDVRYGKNNNNFNGGTILNLNLPYGKYALKVIDIGSGDENRTINLEESEVLDLEMKNDDYLIVIKKQK